MALHVLGIRHHGVGSARNVKSFLEQIRPDILLVEGPPEGESMLNYLADSNLKPPIALLAYLPQQPKKASFYPFAEFSPEWQSMQFAVKNGIPLKFFDLPLAHSFALDIQQEQNTDNYEAAPIQNINTNFGDKLYSDPFQYFADIDGLPDGETWWDLQFESRNNNSQVFDAVKEAVKALRENTQFKNHRDELREAWMRKVIKQTQKDGYNTIVVICGAWHVPALDTNLQIVKEDQELLKGLPKVKIETTWIPWTYERLTFNSGYGAGIHSPGWYHHLWNNNEDDGTIWMSTIAKLLRENRMDTSVAHVVESVRLANALAAIRMRSRAGLNEFNEATTAIMGFGDGIILELIKSQLIVSDRIGEVPISVPKVPLLLDLENLQKKLRMPAEAGIKEYTLDLRQENDLARSILLHRLKIIGIEWGHEGRSTGKGTFKEVWMVQWQPEYSIKVIEQGVWGNTIEEAANNLLIHEAQHQLDVVSLSEMLEKAIPSNLASAVEALVIKLDQVAATANDVQALMKAIPNIARIMRYGDVRQTDTSMLSTIANALLTRSCIGLPLAATGIDETAAQQLLELITQVNQAILLIQLDDKSQEWYETIKILSNNNQCHPLLSGFATRLLLDTKVLSHEEVATHFGYALSTGGEPMNAAFWAEGFLSGSGTILLLDDSLWAILYNWVAGLQEEIFVQLLPLLRRTFSNYSPAERHKIGEKAKLGMDINPILKQQEVDFDFEKGLKGMPVILQLLNLK